MYPPKFLHVYEIEGPAPLGLKDPHFLGIWQEAQYCFVFFGKEDQIPLQIRLEGIRMYHILRYEDWLGGSLGQIKVGRFLITPLWEARPTVGPYELVLDPNVVFGSGQHPTTLQCLKIIGDYDFDVENAIDLGTGTGILALALGKLGIKVKAIDNNPLCVEVCGKNVLRNGLESLVEVSLGDATEESFEAYELVVANLGPDLILKLIQRVNPMVNRLLLLSGITRSFVGGILDEAKRKSYSLIIHEDNGIWHTLFLKGGGHDRKDLPS